MNRPSETERDSDGIGPLDVIGDSTRPLVGRSDDSFEALLREIAAGATVTPPMPLPGDVIAGKYRIEEKLGQGGMGIVYRATHTISEKQVAIKWMLNTSASKQGRSRFIREARAAARIDHENVVDVYDIGQDGDRGLYMVMQLLRGEPLARRIERGTIAITEAVDILLPAMRGVAAVHAAGVIHRDLKPDNIFLCESRQGERRAAKVLDFGISAVGNLEASPSSLTRDGMLLGTPAYMSPEQIQDSRAVDARSDVYAFGVILYECLTGKQPFVADTNHALVHAIVEKEPRDPRALRADIPPQLAKLVMRALAKSRTGRFASVDEMAEALAPWSSTRDASGSLVPSLLPGSRPRLKALLLASCLAAVGLGVYRWGNATRERTSERASPRAASVSPPPTAPQPPPVAAPTPSAHAEPAIVAPTPVARADAAVAPVLDAPTHKKSRTARPELAPARVLPRSGKIAIEEL